MVFIFVSSNVICRALLGSLIQALEKKTLHSVKIEMKNGDTVKFMKSPLFKAIHKHENFKALGLFMLWTGDNAFQRVSEVVHRFGNQHSISKMDIIYTHSSAETKKEMDFWFEKDPVPQKSTENAALPSAEGAPAAAPATAAEDNAVPTNHEGPPAHPEEPIPTYEDAVTEEAETPAPEAHTEQK